MYPYQHNAFLDLFAMNDIIRVPKLCHLKLLPLKRSKRVKGSLIR